MNAESSNAATVYDLAGVGAQSGIDGGEGLVFEGGGFGGKGYEGVYGGVGIGVGAPIGGSGYATYTSNVIIINISDVYDAIMMRLIGGPCD